jgi:hypothetical protein
MRAFFLLPGLGLALFGLGRSTAAPLIGQNDAPVLNAAASPVLQPTYQGLGAPVNGTVVGTPVALLVDMATPVDGVDNVSDLDATEGDGSGSAQLGIAITALGAGGTWYYSVNGGTNWVLAPGVSGSSSLLLAADANTRLYFAANQGTLSSTLTFRAWDRATGTNGSTVATTSNGGSTAFSVATDVATIEVRGLRSVNNAAVTSGTSLTLPPLPGVQAGDLVVAVVAVSGAQTITSALFTLVIDQQQSSATTSRLWVGYRIATGAEPSYTFTFGASTAAAGGVLAYAGMHTTPVEVFGSAASAVSLNHAAPSLTPVLARTLLTTWHEYASSNAWTPPVGMSEVLDQASGASGATGVSVEANQHLLTAAGATGTRTATAAANADAGATAAVAWRFANAAPALDNSRSPVLIAESEDAPAPSGAVGTLVSNLVDLYPPAGGVDNVSDEDGGALAGVAVVSADAANGTWWYSLTNGTSWNPLGTPTNTAARLLAANASTRLYFQPAANFSGTLAQAIIFRAWDQSSGTNGSTADVTVNGGSTPYSTGTDVATLNVSPANDPPVLNTSAPSGPVGTLVSALVDLNPPAGGLNNVTDADPGAGTGLAIVMVNVDLGTAYYSVNNGTDWNPVGPVNMSSARTLAADANTRVYFAPVADLSGGISPFAFVAWDQTTGSNGGLSNANGGGAGTSAFSAASDELYMFVTAVNDAPQATNLNAGETYATNTPLNLIDIVVSDVDHATTSVSLSLSNTAAGSLNSGTSGSVTSTYNSGTGVWAASGAIADVNTLLAGLTFTPATNFNTDFTIAGQVSDGIAPPLSGSKLMTGPGAPVIAIIVHVVLEGSYNAATGLMNGAMRAAGLVPVTEPYTALGYSYTGTSGGTTTPAVLAVGGADAVHDWVIVELRSAADPAVIVYSRAALLQRDGQVCDFDGVSPVTFGVPPGSYYLAVRHRNHLGAMTASAIGYTATPSFLDMAAIGFPCYGTEAQKTITGSFPTQALWAGDVSFNGVVKYTGSGNDRDPILVAVGSTTPNNTVALYSTSDVNLNGVVQYTGSGNDRDPILVNVGSTTPNNVRNQQLP